MNAWPSSAAARGAPWRTLLALLTLALCATAARADVPGRVGRLAEVQGTVWVVDADDGSWTEALRNRPLTGGDRLATDDGARAVVQVGSSTLRLAARTEVEWLRLDDELVQLRVHAGSVALRLRSDEVAREHEVVVAPGRWLPLAAGHYRIDDLGDAAAVQVLSGEGVFDTPDSRKTVRAGERLEFWQSGQSPQTRYDSVAATGDAFDRWLREADRADAALAASRYVSPEMTGWDDLDRHGRWDRHPEFGAIWVPLHVAPGWSPYRYGRWVWLRPWGWTWVDDTPWGFAPFHYGRWMMWSGRWTWVPGPYVRRPVFAPALVGWLGVPGSGVSLSIQLGPLVAWVPLTPYETYRPWYRLPPRHAPIVNPYPGRPPRRDGHGHSLVGVPGAVTVVPGHVLDTRRPVADHAVRRVDPGLLRRLQRPRDDDDRTLAPPPPRRVVTAPGVPGRAVPPGWPGPRRDDRDDRDAREPRPGRGDDVGAGRDRRPGGDWRDDRRDDRRDRPGQPDGRSGRDDDAGRDRRDGGPRFDRRDGDDRGARIEPVPAAPGFAAPATPPPAAPRVDPRPMPPAATPATPRAVVPGFTPPATPPRERAPAMRDERRDDRRDDSRRDAQRFEPRAPAALPSGPQRAPQSAIVAPQRPPPSPLPPSPPRMAERPMPPAMAPTVVPAAPPQAPPTAAPRGSIGAVGVEGAPQRPPPGLEREPGRDPGRDPGREGRRGPLERQSER